MYSYLRSMFRPSCIPVVAVLLLAPSALKAQSCGEQLQQSRQTFKELLATRNQDPESVSAEAFRQASQRMIDLAEDCYSERHGGASPVDGIIDHGGEWLGGGLGPRRNLWGTKWGAGSPYLSPGDHLEAVGPGTPGGQVTYSFMANNVDLSVDVGGNTCLSGNTTACNVAITTLPSFSECMFTEIEAAFAAWSAVADIEFVPVTDNGVPFNAGGASGDIRIGAHPFDGPFGVLAHAFFPPPNGNTAAGDLHFDSDEFWVCDSAQLAGVELDIGIVAIHEIGHSIGLGHEPSATSTAIMNPSYNGALIYGLLADDIIAADSIYGAAGNSVTTMSAPVGIGTDSPGKLLDGVGASSGTFGANDTMLRVQNTNTTTALRRMLELVNNGSPRLAYRDTSNNSTWLLNPAGAGFIINKSGSGSVEVQIFEGGDMTIPGDLRANSFIMISDEQRKTAFQPIEGASLLDRLDELPIMTWEFQRRPGAGRHIGPFAQDVRRLFGFGDSETTVSAGDLVGLALASVQSLNRSVAEKQRKIDELEARLEALERLIRDQE